MLKKTIILLITVFSFIRLQGQISFEAYIAGGVRSAGMSNASVAHSDVWSLLNNQAGLGNIQNISFALYNNSISGLKYGSKVLLLSVPTTSGTFGLSLLHNGISNANLQKVGVAYGKKIGEKFNVGLQFDYLRLYLGNYGADNILTFEAGIITNPIENLYIGFHTFNPVKRKFSTQDENFLITNYKAGLEYTFRKKVTLAIETEMEESEKIMAKFGCDYNFYESLKLRLGFATNPLQYSFGIGFGQNDVQAGVAFTFNEPWNKIHLSFSYAF